MNNTEKLAVLWTNADKDIVEKVVLMYAPGAKMPTSISNKREQNLPA